MSFCSFFFISSFSSRLSLNVAFFGGVNPILFGSWEAVGEIGGGGFWWGTYLIPNMFWQIDSPILFCCCCLSFFFRLLDVLTPLLCVFPVQLLWFLNDWATLIIEAVFIFSLRLFWARLRSSLCLRDETGSHKVNAYVKYSKWEIRFSTLPRKGRSWIEVRLTHLSSYHHHLHPKCAVFFFLFLSLSLFLLLFWGVARDIDNPVEYSLHVC